MEVIKQLIEINKEYTFINYLKNYEEIKKCVVAITDRQMVMLPGIRNFEKEDHWVLAKYLNKAIYDKEKENPNFIYIIALKNEIFIEFPENNLFSPNQIALMGKILKDINDYDNYIFENIGYSNKLTNIHPLGGTEDNFDIQKYMIENISFEKEKINERIIGEVATLKDINNVISEANDDKVLKLAI